MKMSILIIEIYVLLFSCLFHALRTLQQTIYWPPTWNVISKVTAQISEINTVAMFLTFVPP